MLPYLVLVICAWNTNVLPLSTTTSNNAWIYDPLPSKVILLSFARNKWAQGVFLSNKFSLSCFFFSTALSFSSFSLLLPSFLSCSSFFSCNSAILLLRTSTICASFLILKLIRSSKSFFAFYSASTTFLISAFNFYSHLYSSFSCTFYSSFFIYSHVKVFCFSSSLASCSNFCRLTYSAWTRSSKSCFIFRSISFSSSYLLFSSFTSVSCIRYWLSVAHFFSIWARFPILWRKDSSLELS